ncbi:proton-coupled zinc antiporter SLC30A2-like [Tachypleus tridentatus]|uniref:proton-coupled zinc antiporter SLC30A2-like n=2 Tax=Tachypleus tridentatus TaxID=6853 RepID=UPI003FD50739
MNEKIPLNCTDTGRISYETITTTENAIIYCCHGNPPETCCDDKLMLSSSGLPNGRERRISTTSEGHCHPERDEGIDKYARRRLLIVSALCLVFMVGECVGGFLANSLAIATDAAHLLTDFAGFMISLLALWLASRPATKRMSFGWYRAEVIGALTSVLLIWVVTGVLVYMAIQRIVMHHYEIDATIMLITASIGVVINIIMGISLQAGGVPHSHSHGSGEPQSRGHTDSKGKGNINVRAAFIHVLGDFFQSVGVLVAALIIYFKPAYVIVDPICTFLFSILVLITTFAIMKDALNVLMEGMPRGIDFLEVQRLLFNIPSVVKVHNLRIWALSMDKIAVSAHVAIAKGESPTIVLKQASREIRSNFDVFELTLQVEEYREVMQECTQCQDPED